MVPKGLVPVLVQQHRVGGETNTVVRAAARYDLTFKRHLLIFTNFKSSCTITESLSFEIVRPTAIRPKRIVGSATFHGARKFPGYDLLPSGCSSV